MGQLVAENPAKVTLQTTPVQLFEIFDSMIRPLGDLHTGIGSRRPRCESTDTFRPGTDRLIKGGIDNFAGKGRRTLFAVTDRAWIHSPFKNFCNDHIQYARSSDGTGYIRILSFGGYSRFGSDQRTLDAALDRISSDPLLKALIIDVRLSFGGDDRPGLTIASRLADREYLAYAIQARSDPIDPVRWSSPGQVFVNPAARRGFRGPVVELLGPITMSAAETFTQALTGRSPHVTTIGESTQGVFCDPLDRQLPNGWTFSLPNAVIEQQKDHRSMLRASHRTSQHFSRMMTQLPERTLE